VSVAELTRPDHVRADHVVDFDFYKDLSIPEPHDLIARFAAEHPVFWTPRNGGHWVLAGHPELFEASRNTEVFSSRDMSIPPAAFVFRQFPINADPPEHAMYREPLSRAFSPKAMMALQGKIRDLAIELIEKVRDRGSCDFAHEIAEPLPVTIFMQLAGMPLENLAIYREWVTDLLTEADAQKKAALIQTASDAMMEIVAKRKVKREDDLFSVLLDTPIDGRLVTDEEMRGFCLLLFIGGLDTVMNGMCYGARHLARNPELQAELRAHPERITDMMEETLRRYTFTMPPRVIAKDADLFGVHFKEGDKVLLMLAGADLDAREFSDPMKFDLNRENKVHMAFNSGPHRCVGSHLARIEMRILYEELLARLPEFRLDPAKPVEITGSNVIGFKSLNLVWDPA
jgi:cytochrome P450